MKTRMGMTDREPSRSNPAKPSRGRLVVWAVVLLLVGMAAPRLAKENLLSEGGAVEESQALPEFPQSSGLDDSRWIGTEPLTVEAMRGRVWVLKVWTFGCINCVRSIPYANDLTTRFGDDVGVLGIHSPEFDWERDPEALAAALVEHDVRFPSYVDQGLEYFFALDTPAWPTFYVVDRGGNIRGRWVGEVHEGTLRAKAFEGLIRELVEE